jgi:hypothetical protein
MTLSFRKLMAPLGFALIGVALVTLVVGGCPTAGTSPTGGTVTDGIGATNPTGTGSGPTTGDGNVDATTATGTTGDSNGTGSTDGDGSTSGTGDTPSDPNVPSADGFTQAAIIHRAAGGFPADPKYGIPAPEYFHTSGSIQSSVRIPHVSKDGSRIWFAAQDGNGFVDAQLFCMNTDGSGLQEVALPADLPYVPVELWPSADGQVCALIINTGDGMDFSQSTVRLADRRTGLITMLLDGRLIPDGNDDFDNVQITDDGGTVLFKDSRQHIIYGVPAGGGSLSTVSTLAEYTKTACTPREIINFRINGNASALVANIWFYGPSSTYPADIYLKTAVGVTALTNTGDAPRSYDMPEYLGVSDDSRYVVYRRFITAESRYTAHVLDRTAGVLTDLPTGASRYSTLLDSAGTLVFTAWAIDQPYGGTDQLGGLGLPDASSTLEVVEGWAGTSEFTSMSSYGTVLVGTWYNGAFGDPIRLYAWFPNAASYRTGPSITGASYKFDTTADTLTVRVTVAGTTTEVDLQVLYDNFEAFYQLGETLDPFYNERWGGEFSATDQAGVYEYTANLRGLPVDSRYRLRITAADNDAKNFACVDFRPVPVTGESLDVNGDGQGG